ncbi:hypothetical protein J5N97_007684 [Dioscorea zingiberensis]|uniref:Trehalose-phosphatase n=1 Tax=Dioscorea zingiberensis TaxID=325984 RepID=A0A9D5HUR4_9LILI|nr:hypothetical protein J5N97_007684 [Dioscorea zingiberensis]
MMSIAKEKKVVIFLDYDGTLSPIVDDPDCAFMSNSMRLALNKVAQYFPTCIISGRRRDKVYDFVKLNNVYYVGSHGMDIMAPLKCSVNASTSFHEKAVDEKVIEIRPSIKWDKGRALEYLLDTLGFGNNGDAIPLYIGDDKTDEDAFMVLKNRGEGYPIIVSSIPKDTKASYSLRDPSEVMCFLLQLFRWKRSSSADS